MKKIISLFFIFYISLFFTGCSFVKGFLSQIPLFEDSDLDQLTDKAEKAWDEVGKDTLKDAAEDAKNVIFGTADELTWPERETTSDLPKISSGKISEIYEADSILEITIKEISEKAYNEYISELTSALGAPLSTGIFKNNNRLISAMYNENDSTLILTISSVSQKIELIPDESEITFESTDLTISE